MFGETKFTESQHDMLISDYVYNQCTIALAWVSTVALKHLMKSKSGKKGFIWLILQHLRPSVKVVRAGIQTRQEPGIGS